MSAQKTLPAQGRAGMGEHGRTGGALAGIILAGGASARMGRDKAMLDYGAGPAVLRLATQLAACCGEVVVVSARHRVGDFPGLRLVADETPNLGPLMGLVTGLRATTCEWIFVVACDISEVNYEALDLLRRAAAGRQGAVLSVTAGRIEPLFAVYHASVLEVAQELVRRGQRRVGALRQVCDLAVAVAPQPDWYKNVNTPEDFVRAGGRLPPVRKPERISRP